MELEKVVRFKKILEAERQRILDKARDSINELVEKTTNQTGDEGDEAKALSETHLTLRFRDRERQLLDKIENALERIKDGSFGVCEDCGDEIEAKRLEIRPVASLCVLCKETQEKREGAFL